MVSKTMLSRKGDGGGGHWWGMLVVESDGTRENCATRKLQSSPERKNARKFGGARITSDITHPTRPKSKDTLLLMTYLKYLVGTNGIFVTTAGRFFPRT